MKQINSIFDLSFYYYLVSNNTTCVLHSSDKMTIEKKGARKSLTSSSHFPGYRRRKVLPEKLNSPETAAAGTEIQGAVIEKGFEVMDIYKMAEVKAENFLKKKVGRARHFRKSSSMHVYCF